MLMQQRNDIDQRQILFRDHGRVRGAIVDERQVMRVRIHDGQRFDQPLRVLVTPLRSTRVLFLRAGRRSVSALALRAWIAASAPGSHRPQPRTTIFSSSVDVGGGGRREVITGPRRGTHRSAACRWWDLSRSRRCQLPLRLQQLQGVAARCAPSSSAIARILCFRSIFPCRTSSAPSSPSTRYDPLPAQLQYRIHHEDLPAADVDCSNSASGRSSLARHRAK